MEKKDRQGTITALPGRSHCRVKTRKVCRNWMDTLEEVKLELPLRDE